MGVMWARAGCLVLVMDQLGHGERRQHPFASDADYAGSFRASRQDYYFRYNTALQLHLAGESLIGWIAWDLMRGVEFVGPQVGEELAEYGALALLVTAVGIVLYLWMRFEWRFGLSAIIANLHDVVIILGFGTQRVLRHGSAAHPARPG
jgi:hypothetical protein